MFVIVVYDINVKKVTKVHKYLKKILTWVQNSVFEGELRQSKYIIMKNDLKKMISKKEGDTIVIYSFHSEKYFDRVLLGNEKNEITNIL